MLNDWCCNICRLWLGRKKFTVVVPWLCARSLALQRRAALNPNAHHTEYQLYIKIYNVCERGVFASGAICSFCMTSKAPAAHTPKWCLTTLCRERAMHFCRSGLFGATLMASLVATAEIYYARRCAAPFLFFAKSTLCKCAERECSRAELELLQYDTFCVLSHLKVNTPVTSGGREMYNFSGSVSFVVSKSFSSDHSA